MADFHEKNFREKTFNVEFSCKNFVRELLIHNFKTNFVIL